MTIGIGLDEQSDAFPPIGGLPFTPEERTPVDRVNNLITNLFGDLPYDPLKPISAHPPTADSAEVKTGDAAAPILFPNIALALIEFGLGVEKSYNERLHQHANEAAEIQQTIEKLIDLSGKFAVHMEGDGEKALSGEIKSLCLDLKDKGIEILQGNEGKMGRERMAEIKAHISSHTDRLKTDLQKKFTTEIQVKINELHSILECLKTIEKYSSRLNSTIVSNQRVR